MVTDEITRATAEQYLDEMLAAERDSDYGAFTRRFERKDLENFGESRFRKEMFAVREDFGEYRDREYLGSLKGFVDADRPDRHPGCVRYVWRAVFEKNETVIVVGLHERDGKVHVNEIMSYD